MRHSKLAIAFLLTLGCCKSAEGPRDDMAPDGGDCRGPGNYQAGKEGSYRPCCEGLSEQFQELPATDSQGERVCIAPPLRVYACVEGSCGDGRCEAEEDVPCGCAADCPNAALLNAGDGGVSLDAGEDDAGVSLVPDTLTRVAVEWSIGPGGGSRFGECDHDYAESLSLEPGSGRFSWDICQFVPPSTNRIQRGERTLTEAELQAVRNALSALRPAEEVGCGLDGSPVRVTLHSPEESVTYTNCSNRGVGMETRPFIANTGALHGALYGFAERASLPATFDKLELLAARRVIGSAALKNCVWSIRPGYQLDVAARKLSWKRCVAQSGMAAFAPVEGSKQLSDGEFAELLRAYAQIKLGADHTCTELREIALAVGGPGSPEERAAPELHTSRLDITIGENWVSTSSEESTCSGEYGGSPVTGMRALEDMMTELAQ